jgi:hypothetical protein
MEWDKKDSIGQAGFTGLEGFFRLRRELLRPEAIVSS